MDAVNIFFLKQIVRAAKDVSQVHLDLLVHQEVSSEGCSRSSDRGSLSRQLHQVCERQAKHSQVLARRKWMEPPRQEVDLRCGVHHRSLRLLDNDQQGSSQEKGEA